MATPADAPAIAAIYAPIVEHTAISFETEPPSADEMARRVTTRLATHPWLVLEDAEGVAGYVYASPHRDRAAYQWSVDVTAYLAERARGQGHGRALYEALFAILRRQGFRMAYAGITLPNAASVALHEAMGMSLVGVYRNVGWKLGAWRDVGWWGVELQAIAEASPPVAFAALGA